VQHNLTSRAGEKADLASRVFPFFDRSLLGNRILPYPHRRLKFLPDHTLQKFVIRFQYYDIRGTVYEHIWRHECPEDKGELASNKVTGVGPKISFVCARFFDGKNGSRGICKVIVRLFWKTDRVWEERSIIEIQGRMDAVRVRHEKPSGARCK
jgi:hypothetical protein